MNNASTACATNSSDLLSRKKTAFIAWGIPMVLAILGSVLNIFILIGVAFLWGGIACMGNALHCKRAHCYFTGPLYIVLGIISILKWFGFFAFFSSNLILPVFIIGTLLAYSPEFLGKKYF